MATRGPLQNRSKLEVTADILRLLEKGPTPKTYIMYGAGLSFQMLNPYLELLLGSRVIDKLAVPNSMRNDLRSGRMDFLYSLTPKGREALGYLEKLEEMLSLRSFNGQKEKEVVFA